MKGKTKKIVLAVAVIAAVAAGGAAFTASNTVPVSVAGYGQNSVSGADATEIHHTLSADGTHIVSTALTLTGDQTDTIVKAGFGADASSIDMTNSSCVVSTPYDLTSTIVTCTYTAPVLNDDANSKAFAVAVTA
jgi:hypothetical protein